MSPSKPLSLLCNQHGVALPMALLTLMILSALLIGFSVLSASEPTIANNQLRVAQARAIAEAGVERAIWALNNPTDANGIPKVFTTAPAPYNGAQLVAVTAGAATGGYRITVTSAVHPPECPTLAAYERCIIATGWVPNDTAVPRTHQKITVVVLDPAIAFRDPPAALSVRGELQMGGNALVDSRNDTSCGRKMGTLSLGDTNRGGSSDIWGATDNNNTQNQVTDAGGGAIPSPSGDIVKNVAPTAFDSFMFNDGDIDAMRAYAKSRGTYYQGAVTFNAGNPIPDGLVFVDTLSGTNITAEGVTPATAVSDFASVDIHGNAPPSGVFKGWLFVNGSLRIDGNFEMKGLSYAQNDIVYRGTGNGQVSGAMVSRNIRDTSSTSVDSDVYGNGKILYNCLDAKYGGGQIPDRWSIKGGTYKEVSGS